MLLNEELLMLQSGQLHRSDAIDIFIRNACIGFYLLELLEFIDLCK